MGFNRIDAKLRAKASMRNTYPHPMLITLVFLLSTTVLISIIQMFSTNPFERLYEYVQAGYGVEELMSYIYAGSKMSIFVFLSILLSLYRMVMSFGYTSYSLRMARDEQPGYRNLLDGFSMAGRVLLIGILSAVFTFLWGMLGMLPYLVVVVVAAVTGSSFLLYPAIALGIGGVVFEIIVLYRYRLAFYFLLDNPENMTALGAITNSKNAMRGYKFQLFVLDLSFLGWAILVPFTLGILSLWLTPYMGAAEANFYDSATSELPFGPRATGYSGPDSNDSGPRPNEPF